MSELFAQQSTSIHINLNVWWRPMKHNVCREKLQLRLTWSRSPGGELVPARPGAPSPVSVPGPFPTPDLCRGEFQKWHGMGSWIEGGFPVIVPFASGPREPLCLVPFSFSQKLDFLVWCLNMITVFPFNVSFLSPFWSLGRRLSSCICRCTWNRTFLILSWYPIWATWCQVSWPWVYHQLCGRGVSLKFPLTIFSFFKPVNSL